MIKIDNVTMTYGEIRSLHQVTAEIHTGSIFGLIGSNGSGKSTLLRILSGVIRPDTGSISYDEAPVWENPAVNSRNRMQAATTFLPCVRCSHAATHA